MAVILSDGTYRVRHRPHPFTEDAHGLPVAASAPAPGPWRAGARSRQTDGSYHLRLDPAEWPVRPGDQVDGQDGATFILTGWPKKSFNPAGSDVDHVAATAALKPPETP